MSTGRVCRKTVKELNLKNLTQDGAARLLELAHQDVYDTDDMPERWLAMFENLEVASD